LISAESSVFVIGEIGSNHNQSIDIAKELIDVAAEAGVDAVKFQSLKFDRLYFKKNSTRDLEILHNSIDLEEDMFSKLFSYARGKKLIPLSCPTYFEALDILENLDIDAYKIASPQSVGFPSLVRKIIGLNKPMIVSTGYCSYKEICRLADLLKKNNAKDTILLHCISQYPVPNDMLNLRFIDTLKNDFGFLIGFSDHTMSTDVPVLAVAAGACVIEKHFTLSRNMIGPDHASALEPTELKEMVLKIREAEVMLGSHTKHTIAGFELNMKKKVMMKLVAARDLKKGTVLQRKDIIFRRVADGIEDWEINKYIGRKVINDISNMTIIKKSYLR